MNLQSMVFNAVAAQRAETLKTSPQLSLGELIAKLEAMSLTYKDYEGKIKPKKVRYNFEYLHPTNIDSWRGIYAELALDYKEEGEEMSLEDFLNMLRGAIGKTFTGYKGGDFVMGKATPIWVANYGNSGDTGIVGVREDDYEIVLLTDKCES